MAGRELATVDEGYDVISEDLGRAIEPVLNDLFLEDVDGGYAKFEAGASTNSTTMAPQPHPRPPRLCDVGMARYSFFISIDRERSESITRDETYAGILEPVCTGCLSELI